MFYIQLHFSIDHGQKLFPIISVAVFSFPKISIRLDHHLLSNNIPKNGHLISISFSDRLCSVRVRPSAEYASHANPGGTYNPIL